MLTPLHRTYKRWKKQLKLDGGGRVTGYYNLNASYLGYISDKAPKFIFMDTNAPSDAIEFLKAATKDPNTCTWEEAMSQSLAEIKQWKEAALTKEVQQLEQKATWLKIPKSAATVRVIPGCWVFKIKTSPDRRPLKYKARWVLRGDLQELDLDT